MTQPRFFFVTNDRDRAAREFYCHAGNLPHWMAVLDSLDAWSRIPDGAKVIGLWYGAPAILEGWRNSWAAIRAERPGIVGITPADLDVIAEWAWEKRHRPDMLMLEGNDVGDWPGCRAVTRPAGGVDLGLPQIASPTQIAPVVASVPSAANADPVNKPIKRAAKWL